MVDFDDALPHDTIVLCGMDSVMGPLFWPLLTSLSFRPIRSMHVERQQNPGRTLVDILNDCEEGSIVTTCSTAEFVRDIVLTEGYANVRVYQLATRFL